MDCLSRLQMLDEILGFIGTDVLIRLAELVREEIHELPPVHSSSLGKLLDRHDLGMRWFSFSFLNLGI